MHDPAELQQTDVDALWAYLQLFVTAGEAARERETLGFKPSERWNPFNPAKAAARLPKAVADLVGHYGWSRAGSEQQQEAVASAISELLAKNIHWISDTDLRGALLAGAFWVDSLKHPATSDDISLAALEAFSDAVNGFVQSLPLRRVPNEHADAQNRRFRAYQRRIHGYESSTRSPQMLVKRLPRSAQELLEAYEDHLLFESPEAAHAFAATIAVAIGRPVDETLAYQLDLAMATSLVWRDISELPNDQDSHPLLGNRFVDDDRRWDAAAIAVEKALSFLNEPSENSSDPKLVQRAALTPVAGIMLDAESLASIARLDDYLACFAAWIRLGPGLDMAPEDRLPAFDLYFYSDDYGAVAGAEIIANLPTTAIKLIATVDALVTRRKGGPEVAEELAVALGDKALAARYWRTLHTAAAWLNGELSVMEKVEAPEKPHGRRRVERHELSSFSNARQRDAEAILDLGASIAELVRFSHTLTANAETPKGWWQKFHNRELASIPTPRQLLERLPEGSQQLLRLHREILTSEHFGELTRVPKALASVLGRDSEILCVRTLAVGLAAGAIWSDLEEISKGRRSDSLLGADPTQPEERYACGRAQAQLQWGLQELLESASVVGA